MKLKSILFLYCGGTIGQLLTLDGTTTYLKPPKDDREFRDACESIIQKVIAEKGVEITFEMITTKDSTNMTPTDWEIICKRVIKAQEDGFDAVGIAHGTDTLAYTSTALALALHGKEPDKSALTIPVCVTGAQNSIYMDGGDGKFNLENLFRTLLCAMEHNVADVMVNFWNRILLGARTLKTSERNFDAFRSPSFPEVGEIDVDGVHLHVEHLHINGADMSGADAMAPQFGNGVIGIEIVPGLLPSTIHTLGDDPELNAMIFKSLGDGNICTEGDYNMLPEIGYITNKKKKPILITTKFVGGSAVASHYEIGIKAIEAGGIPCFDHTDVAVDVKARWLLGNELATNIDEFREAMLTSYANEVTAIKH